MKDRGSRLFEIAKNWLESDRNVVLSAEPTIDEITEHTSKMFKQYWKTGYDYSEVKIQRFVGIPDKSYMIDFMPYRYLAIMTYMNEVVNMFSRNSEFIIPDYLEDEVYLWEQKGGLCIGASVLGYCLLNEFGLRKERRMRLIQGFYRYKRKEMPFYYNFLPEIQTGLHAWLMIDGAILDFTIKTTQSCTFDFPKTGLPFLCGEAPDRIKLYGFEEGKETVRQYAREMAQEVGMTYYDWIGRHKKDAWEIMNQALGKGRDNV